MRAERDAASAFSLIALKPRPGGSISPFCEPASVTSMPHSSCRRSIDASAGHRVDDQQGGMPGAIDGLTDQRQPAGRARRGLVVHDEHRPDAVIAILAQLRLDRRRIDAARPVAGDELHVEAEPPGHLGPEPRELPVLEDQHPVSRRQRIDERRFPGAGAGRRERSRPGPVVLKTPLRPSSTSRVIAANSALRWSMVGCAIARRTRSGTLVGPGIWRKWRPEL